MNTPQVSRQMLIENGQVRCPGCSSRLELVKEQDKRVHWMKHPPHPTCFLSNQLLRIDRRSGYSEVEHYENPNPQP